jgi:hypothetical protein
MGKDWAKGKTKENNESIKKAAEKHVGMTYNKKNGKYGKSFKNMSKEELEEIVKISTSFRDLLIKIYGVANSGSRDFAIKKWIKDLEIDTSHFTGHGWSKGKTKDTHPSIKKGSENFIEGLKSGRFKPSMLGKQLTKEHKEAISKGHKESSNFNGLIKTKSYSVYSPYVGDTVTVQGTWEKKYAEWLNTKNIPWTKTRTIKFNWIDDQGINRIYYPDFFLPETNEYVEIKGFMWKDESRGLDDKRKMELVIEQNPDKKLTILMKAELKALGIM